ncbi:MAG: MBOAT family O-acyltransferase [Bacillus sp. (in: firmicutes)]
MVFSSLPFLFFFLPLALLLYFISPDKGKNIVLLIISLIFYAWGEPIYIGLMILSAMSDYIHGLFIFKYRERNRFKAKVMLVSSLVINIGLLSFFKYSDFLIENMNVLFGTNLESLNLPLPIGISFYTFQTMSYSIDVYRGQVLPQRNPIALATYVSLFPQLIAGPIVRYDVIAKELMYRKTTISQFADGVRLFIVGLGKKVLLANNIGLLWQTIQNQGSSEWTILSAWLGIIAFAFQIYFDFSGYSDMAVGLGNMFGFRFLRNFHYPYVSKSITEFWRRWHISLGSWFRDYVYIPLGGNRKGKFRLYVNLFIVWGLTGLWHGASWNFVLWGLYFGLLLSIEKAGLLKLISKTPAVFQHLYALFFILIGWVLFVFEDYRDGLSYIKLLFGLSNHELWDMSFLYDSYTNIMLLIIAGFASTPIGMNVYKQLKENTLISISLPFLYMLILVLSTAYLVDESFNPFLYFRF